MFIPITQQALETSRAFTTRNGDGQGPRSKNHPAPFNSELPPIERPITDELLDEMGKALAARLNKLVANLPP